MTPSTEPTFWYLASPYSKYPDGLDTAFVLICQEAGLLIEAGIPVYCPIAHTHPIAKYAEMDAYDHGIWLPADTPFMNLAHGLIVSKMPTWETSKGIEIEMDRFMAEGKPVLLADPGKAVEVVQKYREFWKD